MDARRRPSCGPWRSAGRSSSDAVSPSHWTLPSHASLLTGLDPASLDILSHADALRDDFATVAETFEGAGYRTAAFVGNGRFSFIGAERGFDRGFGEYHHWPYVPTWCRGSFLRLAYKLYWKFGIHGAGAAGRQLAWVERWLDVHPEAPFFLFVHLFDIHSDSHRLPYESPAPYQTLYQPGDVFDGCDAGGKCASELLHALARNADSVTPLTDPEVEAMVGMYDGGIHYTDARLGELLARLDALDQDVIVAVTSDHGEAFFEHGRPLHEDLHQENVHIPMIVTSPGAPAGQRVEGVVSMIDLGPTLVELAGLALPAPLRARSLASTVQGRQAGASRPALSVSESLLALRTDRWAYLVDWDGERIGTERERLFDRRRDPSEQEDVLDRTDAETVASLRETLRQRVAESLDTRGARTDAEDPAELDLPDSELDMLRELGYTD